MNSPDTAQLCIATRDEDLAGFRYLLHPIHQILVYNRFKVVNDDQGGMCPEQFAYLCRFLFLTKLEEIGILHHPNCGIEHIIQPEPLLGVCSCRNPDDGLEWLLE